MLPHEGGRERVVKWLLAMWMARGSEKQCERANEERCDLSRAFREISFGCGVVVFKVNV